MIKIKVACPSKTVTGGIELLHQFAAECNKHENVLAEIWYIFDSNETQIPDEYVKYNTTVNNKVNATDILLFPEIWANCTNYTNFVHHKKLIYWESVDNYFPHTPKVRWYQFGKNVLHITQSEYATKFLTETVGVSVKDIIEITDYINDAFLNVDINTEREKIVLYNPVKGMEYTEKLIALAPDIKFVPIQNMSRTQIVDKMLHSMVYIDFGSFPGADRLPREAASCGMCLITAKRGAAKYQRDLNIPAGFKIDNITYADLGNVADKIKNIFNDFNSYAKAFCAYRAVLKEAKLTFEVGIEELLGRLQNEI